MTGHPTIQHDKSSMHKWFGPNRGTHWVIAGSVAIILLGSYLVYSNRDTTPPIIVAIPATAQAPAPTAPAATAPAATPPAPLAPDK
jgi:hypothetical protein